jgi:hypothetical protein
MFGDYPPLFTNNIDLEKRRWGTPFSFPSFDPEDFKDFPSFPFDTWSWQIRRYYSYWWTFSGRMWDEPLPNEVDKEGKPIPRYPLKINYMQTLCMKRNYTLWGEVGDTPGSPAPVRVLPKQLRHDRGDGSFTEDEHQKQLAFEVEQLVDEVLEENNARAMFYEAGLTQQPLGGIAFRVSRDADNFDLEHQIKVEMILPDFFMPVWDGSNYDLLEVFVVWRVQNRDARLRLGWIGQQNADPVYIEHWTKDEVTITLGGEPLEVTDGKKVVKWDHIPNPFGFVPFVYIPTERSGSFYGLSACENMDGIIKEMNARVADMGDIIYDASHRDLWVRNLGNKTIGKQKLPDGRLALDLGNTPPTGKDAPEIGVVNPPTLPDGLVQFPELLHMQFGRDTFVPPVADGQDEGSQRSALTLAFRMWPLTSKIRVLRGNWTIGLIRLAKMIARLGIQFGHITDDHLKHMRWSVEWAPMIPRDSEMMLNTAILLMQSNALAPIDALESLKVVTDPAAAYKRTQAHIEWLTKLQAAAKAQAAPTETTTPTASSNVDKM